MKPTFNHSKVIVILAAFAVGCVGLVSAQTVRPSAASSSTNYTSKKFAPDGGASVDSASAQAPDESSQDQLIRLLTEQNKRLKEKVDRLEKENAELKAKLAEKQ